MSHSTEDGDDQALTVFKNDLNDRISEVHSTGSFAAFGEIEKFPHPGISIHQHIVGLPLSEGDASMLVQASHRAPFGKGTETVIDEAVRKTWEVDPSEIQFLNKSWQSCVDQTAEQAAKELGVANGSINVRAEFYKMLIYEKGAMFKEHKDNEKVRGMFGTLVICLPSKHTGGAVCLYHGKKSVRFDTSENSAFGATFIAWYTDVAHEIEPVQTGCQWFLRYHLINESKDPYRSASALDARTEDFAQALTQWQNLDNEPPYLVFPLSHRNTDRYTESNPVKGEDYYRVRQVAQGCAVHGQIDVLLANMSMHINEPNDQDVGCEKWSGLSVSHIVDLEGSDLSVYEDLPIKKTYLLREMLYSDRKPDEYCRDQCWGNQHAAINQWFNDRVMIIVPRRFIMSFLLGENYSHEDLDRLLSRLEEHLSKKWDDANLCGLTLQICDSSLSRNYESDDAKDLYLGPVAIHAAFMRDTSLFTETVKQIACGFKKEYYYALGELIDPRDPDVQEHDIIDALIKAKKLHQIHENLNAFRDGFFQANSLPSDQSHLRRWHDTLMCKCLDRLNNCYEEDASTLIRIILDPDKEQINQDILYQGVRKFIMEFQHAEILTNALIVELFLNLQHQDSSAKRYLESLLRRVIESMISNFDLSRYATYIKTRSSRAFKKSSRNSGLREKETQSIPAGPIKAFYEYVTAHEQGTPTGLLERIQTQASELSVEQFLMSFLGELITVVDVSSAQVQGCIQSLVTIYITRKVGKEPRKPSDWARPEEICDCDDHLNMNAFLRDAELQQHILPSQELRLFRRYHYCFQYLEFDDVDRETVSVRKTLKWWEEQHRDWERRASNALEALRNLPQAKLKDCLTHRYDKIMDLRDLKVIHNSTIPQKRAQDDL